MGTYSKCSFSDEDEMSSNKAQMTTAINLQNAESPDTSNIKHFQWKRIHSFAITEEQIDIRLITSMLLATQPLIWDC